MITIIITNLRSPTFYTYVHIEKDAQPYIFSAVFTKERSVTGLVSSMGCRAVTFPEFGYILLP
jgi:hypothetical protein